MTKQFLTVIFLFAFLAGSLTLANASSYTSAESVDQEQPLTGYGFGFSDTTIHWQEFLPTLNRLTAVELYIYRNNDPGNLIVELITVDERPLGSKTIPPADVTSNTWLRVEFGSDIELTPGVKYRIYVHSDQPSPDPSNRYAWDGSNSSAYRDDCLNDVIGDWPGFDYAFRTLGYQEYDVYLPIVTNS